MRTPILFLATVLCFGSAIAAPHARSAAHAQPDLSFVKKYSANSVAEMKWGKSIWDDAQFKAALARTVGKDKVKVLYGAWSKKGLVTTNPVVEQGIYYFDAKKPHDAGDNHVIVYINLGKFPGDPAANTIQACWRQTEPGRPTQVTWFATGQSTRQLPSNMSEEMDPLPILRQYGHGTIGPW